MNERQAQEEQESIFTGISDFRKQKRNLSINRALLYIIAAWWFVQSVVYAIKWSIPQASSYKFNRQITLYLMVESAVIGIVFLVLAVWSYKKAALAYLVAFIFYGIISFGFIYINSFHFPNDLIRIFILILLVKGYEDAREYEQIKTTLNNPQP